ncbi:MAG: hypothetical protein ACRD1K_17680 [Acidimicrobiales bacterium]
MVTVHGDIDETAARHLGELLTDIIDGHGNLTVVVDLHDARTGNAGDLSVFAEAGERAARRDGSPTLSDPPEHLRTALRLRVRSGTTRAAPARAARSWNPFPAFGRPSSSAPDPN